MNSFLGGKSVSVNKFLPLILIVLLLSHLLPLSIIPANVQAASKPSVPQFTVKFIDKSYDVPPTRTTDPYTGKTITEPSYHVNDGLLEVTIKNQPYTPSPTSDGHLYYLVMFKGHFGGDNDWRGLPPTDNSLRPTTGYIEQSDSGYTVLTHYPVKFDSGTKLDFRAKAVTGYQQILPPPTSWHMNVETESDWSSIQTITITYDSSPSSPSQTTNPPIVQPSNPDNPSQPQNPQQPYLMIIACSTCIIAALLGVIAYLLKQRKPSSLNNDINVDSVN